MKKMLIILGLAALSVCMGQQLETVIPLPDTLCQLDSPKHMVYFAPANRAFVAGDGGGTNNLIVLDVGQNQREAVIDVNGSVYQLLCVDTLGKVFCANANSGRVTIVDAWTLEVKAVLPTGAGPRAMCVSPEGSRVYVVNRYGGTVTVIDGIADSIVATVPVGSERLAGICYCRSADKVYCADEDSNAIVAIDAITNHVVATIPVGRGPTDLVCPLGLGKLFAAERLGDRISVVDVAGDSIIATATTANEPWALHYCPLNGIVYCACATGDSVTAIDAQTNQVVAHIPVGREPVSLECDTTTGRLFCVNSHSDDVSVIDVYTNQVVAVLPFREFPQVARLVDTGRKLYVLNFGPADVTVIDAETYAVETVIPVGRGDLTDLCYAAEVGKLYVLSETCDRVYVVDGATNALLATIPVTEGPFELSYNARDSKVYCAGSHRKEVTVLDALGDSVLKTFSLPGEPVAACYHPGVGKYYCSCADYSIAVYDGRSDSLVAAIPTLALGARDLICNTHDGKLYCHDDYYVAIVDAESDSVLGRISVWWIPYLLAYNPISNKVYSVYWDQPRYRLAVIDGSGDSIIVRTLAAMDQPVAMMHHRPENKVYVANWGSGSISVVDGVTNQYLHSLQPRSFATRDLCSDAAYNRVYCSFQDSVVFAIDACHDTVCAEVRLPAYAWHLEMNPTHGRVYVTLQEDLGVIRDTTPAGLAGGRPTHADVAGLGPTVVPRMLSLTGMHDAVLLDITGRRVMELKPGANDIRHVAPGIYFLRRPKTEDGGPSTAVRKIVIQR